MLKKVLFKLFEKNSLFFLTWVFGLGFALLVYLAFSTIKKAVGQVETDQKVLKKQLLVTKVKTAVKNKNVVAKKEDKKKVTALKKVKKRVVVLSEDNVLNVVGVVNGDMVLRVAKKLKELNRINDDGPIYAVIDSEGGSVGKLLDLINLFDTSRRPVYTLAINAFSAAAYLHQMGKRRLVYNKTLLFFHRAFMDGSPDGNRTIHLDSKKASTFLNAVRKVIKELDERVVRRTNLTFDEFVNKYRVDWWVTPKEALKYKFADEFVNVRCDKSLDGFEVRKDKVFFIFVFIEATVKVPKCPLLAHIKKPVEKKKRKKSKKFSEEDKEELAKYLFEKMKNMDINKNKININTSYMYDQIRW